MANSPISPAVLLALRTWQQTKQAAISVHRSLSPDELAAVQDAQARWFPRLLTGDGTPLPETMSSPDKGSVIHGGVGAALGGGAGAGLGALAGHPQLGAALGAAFGGGLGAAHGYHARRRWNEDMADLMRRLPEGATYRDYLADSGDADYANDRLQNLRAMRFIAKDLADDANAGG